MKTQIFTLAALVASVNANEFWGGEIRTRQPFQYGKFKTRIQGSGQKGTCASFFTFWNGQSDLPWSVSEWEEIDIELVPTKADDFSMNLIYKNQTQDHSYVDNFKAGSDWHEYEIIWKPSYIAWYLDGREVRRSTDASESVRDMDKASLLYMNFWTPTFDKWGRGLDEAQMPFYTKYDYVEAYDWDASTDSFTLRFRDDFDTLDQNTWRVSDEWGFPDNSTKFMETMTYVQDGNLVLKLDRTLNPERPDNNVTPQPTPTPSPTPSPEECDELTIDSQGLRFGNRCEQKHNRTACESCQEDCYQSWSTMDPNGWASEDAQCRCLPDQGTSESYSYGYLANDQAAGLCGSDCTQCRWSWPSNDSLLWKSDHLMARCMPSDMSPYNPDEDKNDNSDNSQEDEYANWQPDPEIQYSNDCENLYDQQCGSNCTECKWSWPKGDPRSWRSDDAACRCEAKKTFIWGDMCSNLNDGLCGDHCKECRKATLFDDSQEACRCKAW